MNLLYHPLHVRRCATCGCPERQALDYPGVPDPPRGLPHYPNCPIAEAIRRRIARDNERITRESARRRRLREDANA